MSEFATIAKAALQTSPEVAQQNKTGSSGQAFNQVLQEGANNQENAVNKTTNTDIAPVRNDATVRPLDPRVEKLSQDLVDRLQQTPPPASITGAEQYTPNLSQSDVWTQFLHGKTRINYMQEVATHNADLKGNGQFLSRLSQAEKEFQSIDSVLKSGKEFSQGELIGLQMRLYQVSQHIEVMSKIVDQMTGGVKTILNTNV